MSTQDESKVHYKVLARKYRPKSFADLIGQDVLVKTLSNAILQNRLAHAFVFTGVRGVGKTTTARILARILQCEKRIDDSEKRLTEACGTCKNCLALDSDSHVDVLEMDAASRTGIDDIREILDGVRYRPVMGAYKVYIIDEVHMLSKQAFNALLKTLEEPPQHVKFIFATTEIKRVPITILSRCQRFDLLRVDSSTIIQHLERIADQENVSLSPEAFSIIARVSEGSVRDALSILDQSLAQNFICDKTTKIESHTIREMIGLVDRIQSFELLEYLLKGQIAEALHQFEKMFVKGADPILVLQELAELVHMTLREKIICHEREVKNKPIEFDEAILFSDTERTKLASLSHLFSIPTLTQAWQIFLKGIQEVQISGNPNIAAEMIFIRLAYMAEQPTLWELTQKLEAQPKNEGNLPRSLASNTKTIQSMTRNEDSSRTESSSSSSQKTFAEFKPAQASSIKSMSNLALKSDVQPDIKQDTFYEIQTFEDIIKHCDQKKEAILKTELSSHVHLIKFEKNHIKMRLSDRASPSLPGKLSKILELWTGEKWLISLQSEGGNPTLSEKRAQAFKDHEKKIQDNPHVKKVLETFPGSRIRSIKIKKDGEE